MLAIDCEILAFAVATPADHLSCKGVAVTSDTDCLHLVGLCRNIYHSNNSFHVYLMRVLHADSRVNWHLYDDQREANRVVAPVAALLI